ncbi:phage tail protein [Nodosilinea sp. LEGE 07088]|uniref:phage tail protein n=1 Tax=Nodosilinea sp. LEGE 07088 TaxID=2777968 RepID=UPI0018818D12|nr:phage tail protein [Nodosilinea sp. LEGE 07088]MBE9141291.1 phage tail protein [Nodosilinea sp. LEGE 07088]
MAGWQELLAANRFYLELKLEGSDTSADATFLECQGFKRSQEAVEISEVTPKKWGQANLGRSVHTKIPGGAKTENIILRRGMTGSMTFWKWFEAVETGQWAKQLRNGSLVIYDQGGQEQARFDFQNAWPLRYTAADVSAQSTDLEIEELEIAVDTFVRVR